MDFKRIEAIFLCAFLSLNVFLLFSIRQGITGADRLTETSATSTLENRLISEKISFSTPFSDELSEGYYLSATISNFASVNHFQLSEQDVLVDKQVLSSNFVTPVEFPLEKGQPGKELTAFLRNEKAFLYGTNYTFFNEKTSDDTTFTFTQMYEGLPFNDDTSELQLEVVERNKNKIELLGYRQTYLEKIEPLREKQDVISEETAVETLFMNNRIPREVKITKTQLAYSRIFSVRGKHVYIPTWFVWIESGKNNKAIEKVNAFTNSIISTSVPEMKKQVD